MNFLNKFTWYDWHGYNQQIFKLINHLYASPAYDSGMLFLTHTFDDENYLYFFSAFIAYAIISAMWRRMRGISDGKRHYLTRWLGVISVLAVASVVVSVTVKPMKQDFAYPRPYVVFARDDVRVLEHLPAAKDHHSFPSGHAAFITLLVMSLWPVLSRDMRLVGGVLIFAVCWSRLAVGVHFPADVLAGFVVTYIIVSITRRFVYWLLDTLFGLQC